MSSPMIVLQSPLYYHQLELLCCVYSSVEVLRVSQGKLGLYHSKTKIQVFYTVDFSQKTKPCVSLQSRGTTKHLKHVQFLPMA